MDSPLIYLTLCTMRNQLRVRTRRLRQPRYLIGSIVGLAYFATIFGRPFAAARRGNSAGPLAQVVHSVTAVHIAAVGLLLTLALAWLWPGGRKPALAFTRADVQFLFTAPIARRRLVRYRVTRSLLSSLIGSAFVTLFMRPASLVQALTFWVGVALMMGIVNLHLTGITLSTVRIPLAADLASPAGRPRDVVRWWLPRAIVALAVAALVLDVIARWSIIGASATGGSAVIAAVGSLLSSGVSGVVLWPLAMLARLPLADSPAAFATALPWALLVLAINYLWVIRVDAPFEEASAELSEKLARVRTEGVKALRQPRPSVATPYRLAPEGKLELAILWKNLISMGRFLSPATLVRFCLAIVLPAVLVARGGRARQADALGFAFLVLAVITVWVGPLMMRADLRQDLPNLAVLRTWPIRAATLVRGELLAPAAVLVPIAWMAFVAAAIVATRVSAGAQTADAWSWLAAAMAVTPGVILVQLLIQNGLAVMFPSWVAIGPAKGGVDVMGQRMLVMAASFLALALALVPPAIVAGILLLIVRALTGAVPIVLPGLGAAAVLLVEVLIGSELLGVLLDRTDVTALDPTEA